MNADLMMIVDPLTEFDKRDQLKKRIKRISSVKFKLTYITYVLKNSYDSKAIYYIFVLKRRENFQNMIIRMLFSLS
jgi:hypothetical protein